MMHLIDYNTQQKIAFHSYTQLLEHTLSLAFHEWSGTDIFIQSVVEQIKELHTNHILSIQPNICESCNE